MYRILFHTGLVRVFWRQLYASRSFEYIASCSSDGQVLYPYGRFETFVMNLRNEATKKGNNFVELNPMKLHNDTDPSSKQLMSMLLQSELRRTSGSFVLKGWLYILGSVILFGPWIIMLLYLSKAA